MAIINISSMVSYYNTGNHSDSGTATCSGYSKAQDAKNEAQARAQSAANAVATGIPSTGGSSSTTDLKFGNDYTNNSSIGTPGAAMDPDEGTYEGWCTWSVTTRSSKMYQLKLKFTIPSGLTANIIDSASITFTATANGTNVVTYNLCAPKTTEQTNYQKYSETTVIDTSKYVAFDSPGNTNAKSYTLTITDIFKQCITNNQGWVTILYPADKLSANRSMIISGTPQITYNAKNTIRIVNGSNLDTYTINIVSGSTLVPYRATIVSGSNLIDYS